MRTPWHIWAVGILSLLWNAGGAFDYLMTQLQNEAYLGQLNEAQRAFLDARPVWFDACLALWVWGSILGSVLILLRSRFAATAFGVSILGLLGSSIWSFFIADPSAVEVNGTFGLVFSAAIVAILLALYTYSRTMSGKGHLR